MVSGALCCSVQHFLSPLYLDQPKPLRPQQYPTLRTPRSPEPYRIRWRFTHSAADPVGTNVGKAFGRDSGTVSKTAGQLTASNSNSKGLRASGDADTRWDTGEASPAARP